MQTDDDIWFPAKKYGYGWGLPRCWQGWVVLGTYIALLALGGVAFIGTKRAPYFVLWLTFLSVALIAICTWKGEPLRWRWRGK